MKEKKINKDKKRIVRIVVFIILMVLFLLLLNRCGYLKFPWEDSDRVLISGDFLPEGGDAEDGHLPSMSEEEILAQMQKAADESRFAFKINSQPVFEDGSSEGNLMIENPSYNIYPMNVKIYSGSEEKEDQLLYESGGILPNQYIEKGKLTKELAAGSYQATAYFYVFHPDTKSYLGKQTATIHITVKN